MAETKKQSRPVKATANPQGVRFTYGTPVDLASLGDRLTISNRLAAGKFKLEAHYPAKQFNNKAEYINKRKEGSYCRFYDNKSPYFIARTVWDADRMPGIHMKAKNKFGETYTFVVTPKLDDPTKVTILGGYVIPTTDGPVLCTGAIGELEAVGDDGDFKVVTYDKPNIRCPKSATGKVPTSMEYVKRPSKPRKTAADYCKPKHSFKHPTDIRAAEMVGEMADWIDEGTECYSCGWEGTIGELGIETDPEDYTMPIMVCPLCGEDEWLSDLFEAEAGEHDEPCFSCDGMGADTQGKCGYCDGSGMMSETLKADLAAFDSEYFDAECGCWKGLEAEDEPTCASCGEAVKEDDIIGDGTNRGLCCVPDYYDEEDDEYYGEMYDAETRVTIEHEDDFDIYKGFSVYDENDNEGVVISMNAEAKKELSFMDWAKQEEASHLKKYGAEGKKNCGCGQDPCITYGAEVLEAPLAGAGSTMDIAKDTDLGSFTSKELTESSAISGDFDHASLNYSGHQNIEARAEDSSFGWLQTVGVVSAFAAGLISAKKIIEIGDDE